MPAIPTDDDHRDERQRGSARRRAGGRRAAGAVPVGEPPREDPRLSGRDQWEPDWSGAPSADRPGPGVAAQEGQSVQETHDPQAGQEPQEDGPEQPALPVARVRRLLSLVIAGFSLLVTAALLLGAHTIRPSDAVVVFGMQALFVIVWTVASQPPAPRVVMVVGFVVAIGADVAAVQTKVASLEPLAYLLAAGFVAGVIGQLFRPAGRIRVTESLGSSLVVVVGVVSFATLIELTRHGGGTQALIACLGAAGIAVAVARLTDIVAPIPRVAPQVPRGGLGVVLGTMAGTAGAAVAGANLHGLHTTPAALAGLATALVAAMVDLSVGYAEAGRQVEGEALVLWLARHMQGPLGALAFSAPAAYAASVLLLDLA